MNLSVSPANSPGHQSAAPSFAASSEVILGISGITVQQRSQVLFRQHRSGALVSL